MICPWFRPSRVLFLALSSISFHYLRRSSKASKLKILRFRLTSPFLCRTNLSSWQHTRHRQWIRIWESMGSVQLRPHQGIDEIYYLDWLISRKKPWLELARHKIRTHFLHPKWWTNSTSRGPRTDSRDFKHLAEWFNGNKHAMMVMIPHFN